MELIRDEGWASFAMRTLRKLSKLIHEEREHILLELELSAVVHPDKGVQKHARIVAVTRDDLANMCRGLQDRVCKALERAVGSGQPCFVALAGEEVLGYTYYRVDSPFQSRLLGRTLDLGKKGVLVNWIYVFPRYRGSRVGQELVVNSLLQLEAQGYEKVMAIAFEDNAPSMKLWRSLGFQETERVVLERFLFWREMRRAVQVGGSDSLK